MTATFETKPIGRLLRSNGPTARLLTEARVIELSRRATSADLKLCREAAAFDSQAVDVGASVGNYSLAMAKSVGRHGRVIALEANRTVFQELVNSTWGSNVTAVNLAASDENGWAELLVPSGSGGRAQEPLATLSRRPNASGTREKVRTVRLDDIIPAEPRVSVIKIDVEGHESAVLRGALDTIRTHRPKLIVEIEQRHIGNTPLDEVVGLLTDEGYSCRGIAGGTLLPWAEFDVGRDQLGHLSEDRAFILPGHEDHYVNNFYFEPAK